MLKTAAPVSANIDASPRLIDVEDDFIIIPSCRSSDIAVSERLRRERSRVSAVTHEVQILHPYCIRSEKTSAATIPMILLITVTHGKELLCLRDENSWI
jgi:hypothetical protein